MRDITPVTAPLAAEISIQRRRDGAVQRGAGHRPPITTRGDAGPEHASSE